MAQTIKIKRSTGSAAPSTLAQGELAYSKDGNKLYIGDPATVNTPIQINKGKIEAIDTSAADILQVDSDNELAGVDAGSADAIVFWDDSASKLTYMTPTNLLDFASLNTTDDVTFNDLTVTGNLTITGDIDSYNVTNLNVTDKTITVNEGGTEAGSDGSGLIVDRGAADDAFIKWDETDGKFNFSDGIQVATQTVISDSKRFYASDGTDNKAAFSFANSSSTGISYKSANDRLQFLVNGAVKAYIQPGSSNPITPVMYVDGRTEVNGPIYATNDGNSGNWKAGYDYSQIGHVPLAGGTMTGNLNFGDSNKVQLGAGSDLALYHDGSNSYIEDVGTGNLIIRSNGTSLNLQNNDDEDFISCNVTNNEVIIYHNNDKVLETETTGITVTHTDGSTGTITGNLTGNADTATALATSRNFSITGDITANAISFDGSGAVALNASIDAGVVDTTELAAGAVTFAKLDGASVTTSSETFSDSDTQLMTAKAINDRIESFGYTTNVGDITAVTLRNNSDQSPADSSIVFGTGGTNTASGTNGSLTFRMAVGTIDGGTY